MVMIAKRTGLIRGLAGTRRVRKGVTTADDGADIVRTHPHLWEPLRVDYPAAFMLWPDPPGAAGEPVDREVVVPRADYDSACEQIAAMHAAAVGEVRGPIRGVVEDVADLRAERDELRRIVDGLPREDEPDTATTPAGDADLVDGAATPPASKPRKATRAKATADDADAA